ncbi:MAG TPA: PQQ-dependent sugar dehydrogenase [Candidatus Limnocylindrales bacterium]
MRVPHSPRAVVSVIFVVLAVLAVPSPAGAVDPSDAPPEGITLRPPPVVSPAAPTTPAAPATVPTGFRDELVLGGFTEPVAAAFAADGRIVVAEKRGRIQIFASASDTAPGVSTLLETGVYNLWDRGLLGMTLDPAFTTGRPYIYVAYTANDILGDGLGQPRWPSDPAAPWNERCPDPPGTTTDGCVVSGRVSRLTVSGKSVTREDELVHDWCQQFPSHSMGHLAFGPDGALYVSGGEGASFFDSDYGQFGGTRPNTTNPVTPANPCGDPPNPKGTANTLPAAQGGALRSQDLRSTSDPVGLNGTIIRIDPDTGAAWPSNNLIGSSDANARRIVAYGLRNPFRFTLRPGTEEVWISDVGNFSWEEINLIANPDAAPKNYGWPCYEGTPRNGDWDALNVTMCEQLYSAPPGTVTAPVFAYHHNDPVVGGDPCGTGSSSIAGLLFLPTNTGYPDAYDGALFISDYNRRCIWWAPRKADGTPNFSQRALFADLRPLGGTDGGAVHLTTAPNGDLVYTAFFHGQVRRIRYYGTNVPPDASFTATPDSGPTPLTVTFDASSTTDANPGDPLTYAWDLDGDGAFDDGTDVVETLTYAAKAVIAVQLRVTDGLGATDTATRTISPGHGRPTVSITQPSPDFLWTVGPPNGTVSFAADGRDANGGSLAGSAYAWTVSIEHCPSNCHSHPGFFTASGSSGSFAAPDHGYPSHLRLTVTVTSDGLTATDSLDLYPATGVVRARVDPPAIGAVIAGQSGTPPPDVTAIVGSSVTVAAEATATLGPTQYQLDSWSDGGAAAHGVKVAAGTTTVTARYVATGPVTEFQAVDPVRILDTRTGNGLSGAFVSTTPRSFQVTGRAGVPADAIAVTGNLTITRPTGAGHVALTPTPTANPPSSNLNVPAGVTRASVVTASLGPGGKLSATYVSSAGKTAHLIFDVTGYFTATANGATYHPLDPVRLLDTRSGNGLSGRFAAGSTRTWAIAGRETVPSTATAITANLTITGPTANGHVTLSPAGSPVPATSTLNFTAGETAANGVVIRLGTNGRLSAVLGGPTGSTAHLVLDVTGYFVGDDAGARYVPLFPSRRLDTRIGLGLPGSLAANDGQELVVAGRLGVPLDAVAINGTLTATGPSAAGHLALLRVVADTSQTSTLNVAAGQDRANGVFGELSSTGTVGLLYVGPDGATSDAVLDLAGYFR